MASFTINFCNSVIMFAEENLSSNHGNKYKLGMLLVLVQPILFKFYQVKMVLQYVHSKIYVHRFFSKFNYFEHCEWSFTQFTLAVTCVSVNTEGTLILATSNTYVTNNEKTNWFDLLMSLYNIYNQLD